MRCVKETDGEKIVCIWPGIAQRQVRWQGHLAKALVLDLMDETNCRLFSPVTLKSLSLLHGHADFYSHLRQLRLVRVFRSGRWEKTQRGRAQETLPLCLVPSIRHGEAQRT